MAAHQQIGKVILEGANFTESIDVQQAAVRTSGTYLPVDVHALCVAISSDADDGSGVSAARILGAPTDNLESVTANDLFDDHQYEAYVQVSGLVRYRRVLSYFAVPQRDHQCAVRAGIHLNPPTKRVQELDLSGGGSSITGSISHNVKRLAHLLTLDLSANNLTGKIPWAALLRCRRLQRLILQSTRDPSNTFATSVLPEKLGQLKDLRELWLPNCNVQGRLPES